VISSTKSLFLIILIVCLPMSFLVAQSNDDCMLCHEDPDLVKERDGREVSLFIHMESFLKSIHAEMECVDCHQDLVDAEFPHEENLEPVKCGMCHDDIGEIYDASLHGRLVHEGAKLAPRCWSCHGSHYILPKSDDKSQTNKFNIPFMCGYCHKEGTPVTRTYDIPQDSILSHYSQSIHGIGLYQQGLTVTAVCSDCHTAHNVQSSADPKSSIHRDNVARTCEQCHGQIEKVHRKVVRGELWAKEPNKVPVCIDCHPPHEIRQVFYEEGWADKDCMKCHADPNLVSVRDGDTISMHVDSSEVQHSMHRQVTCAQCHTGLSKDHKRPCATVIPKVDCSICHAEVVQTYATSTHGILNDRGDPDAPECTDCHGKHDVMAHREPRSPTFPRNVPDLCGECHAAGGKAAVRHKDPTRDVVAEYETGIHGKGLIQSGLVVTAMCTDCHTAHHVLPRADTASSVNRDNIPKTCAKCHNGIYEQFSQSIHSPLVSESKEKLPVCDDCHESHGIPSSDLDDFKLEIMLTCGQCHKEVSLSYFDTFHGKVSKLGYMAAAKCYDCHGAHDILPPDNPHSHLSRQNIVKTCAKCHPGSHRQFAGYLTHATHHDKTKYPILFYTFWFMTTLLVVTLTIAGTHTIMWLPRSFQAMREHKKLRQAYHGRMEFRRFDTLQSVLHIFTIISFLGLAVTGMTLKFSYLGWAQFLSRVLGGFQSTGYIHRICAVILIITFLIHVYDLIKKKIRKKRSIRQMIFGPEAMMFNRKDGRDFIATLKWFIGAGPRPEYGRWTYWEKFDYFAVFWGVAVIGSTGMMLWFPEFFTRFLPGWIINVATIVHSDEALLAVAFIFTVHFFNSHFRPDKFPMDTVMFTGRVPLDEFKIDRPQQYRQLMDSREIKRHLVEPLPPLVVRGLRIFGTIALIIGLSLILLILYAEIFGYR
jgi:cytochrome b subunit of formate dehydrogenase